MQTGLQGATCLYDCTHKALPSRGATLRGVREVTYSPAGSKDRGSPKNILVDQRADPSSELA